MEVQVDEQGSEDRKDPSMTDRQAGHAFPGIQCQSMFTSIYVEDRCPNHGNPGNLQAFKLQPQETCRSLCEPGFLLWFGACHDVFFVGMVWLQH